MDGNKLIKGRKRHVVVDVLGFPMAVFVGSANPHDSTDAKRVLDPIIKKFPRLQCVLGDAAYSGDLQSWFHHVDKKRLLRLEITKKPPGIKGFVVIAKRWIVERSFGWLQHFRRLSRDFEITCSSARAMVMLAFSRLMLRRLVKENGV